MAKKPCNYKFNGQTYSETDFKKMLSDGLLDKFVLDDNASIPSVFGKNKVNPNETAAQKFRAPVTEAKQTYSDVQKVTEDSYYDNVSNNLIEKDGKNWNVKNEVTGEIYHTAKSLKDATNWQETENQITGRSVESKSAEAAPTPQAKTKEQLDKEFNSLNKQYLKDEKLLDEATKNNEDTTEIENRLDETQAKMSEVSNQLETISTPKSETKVNAIESGADMLDKMSEEERDNFMEDWFEDRIPRESLPGGIDAVMFSEARKVAPKPMTKPKRLTMDNAFELSNFHGFVINIDGEIYGLDKFEDPDATSDAEDRFGDPKEYVWAYTKIKDGSGSKSVETYTSDIDEVIDKIKTSQKATAPIAETKAEPTAKAEEEQNQIAKKAGISPKNLKDLYKVNKELFELDRVKSFVNAIAMDRMIGSMARRAGVDKSEMYSRLKFEKSTEKDLPTGVKLQVDAWHGSPYQFDKFTTEKMGTGEGAQAFGWGLYFTDLKGIAENYAKNLSLPKFDDFIDKFKKSSDYSKLNNTAINNIIDFSENYDYDYDKVLDALKRNDYEGDMEDAINFLENNKNLYEKRSKNLYKVSLHKGKTPDQYTWLEWDRKPSSTLKEKIKNGINNKNLKNKINSLNDDFGKKYSKIADKVSDKRALNFVIENFEKAKSFDKISSELSKSDMSIVKHLHENLKESKKINNLLEFDYQLNNFDGKNIYSQLSSFLGGPKEASLFLLDNGIDGVKYPSESISRGATSDTARGFNYVVFDENAVSIEEAIKFQKDANKARGAAMVAMDGKAVIYALTDPNVSTPMHELAHVYEHYLTDAERNKILKAAGTDTWSTKTSEYFARGFEKYLSDGKSPIESLTKVFEKFKEWLTDIYSGIKNSDIDINLNKDMKSIYDTIFKEGGSKPTTEKVERKGPVEVEAETKYGSKVTYKAEILPDGTVTVQSTAEAPFGGQAINPKIPNLEIRTDANGNRYVETPKSETRVYIDKVKEAPKAKEAPVKEEVQGKGQPTKVKIYAREPKIDDRGMPILTEYSREVEFTKNKRAKSNEIAWETTVNGEKVKATPEQVKRIEKALAEQQRKETKPAQEKKKRAEENLKAMQEQAEGIDEKEAAQGEDAEWAAEAAAEDTRPKEKTTKRGDKKSFLASQARGNSTRLLQALEERFGKLFPNIAIVNDENAFNQKAYDLGRDPQSAAIFSDGIIYLNPLVANNNTAFEEYSHVYLSVLEQVNKPLYNKLIEETKKNGKEYMDEVLNDPAYSDIHDNANAVAFEAASKMVADRAEKIFDSARKNPLLDTIKRIWQNIADWFKVKSKLDINRDNLDDIVRRVARELNGKMRISSISSEDLRDIQNYNIRTEVKVDARSIMNQSSERAKWFRDNFLPYKGLREDIAQDLTKGRNNIAVFEQRSKAVIEDFNKGISEYNKQNGIDSKEGKVEVLQKVNQALQDPIFRANWFASDASADELVKPHVEKMRGMVDDLQQQLVDSGLLTDDLEVSITGNMDMYVNTAYYAFSGLNQGNWLDLFTPQEQEQILDYVHQTKYTPARELTYTIADDGKVTARFTNAYDEKSQSDIKLDNLDALKQFLGGTKRVGSKTPLNVDKLSFNTSKNKEHSIPFEFNGLDISSLGNEFGFRPNDDLLKSSINEIGRANQDLNKISDLIHGRSKLTGRQAAGATKRKKNLTDIQKLLLKEIKDPATNFMRTVAKQSNLLFSGQIEQAIIDSKYMANYGKPVGQLTQQVNNPASRLNGYYVTPEMHDFLMGKSAKSLIEIAKSGVRALGGKSTPKSMAQGNLVGFFNTGSAIAKAYVTIFSIGSNAANYWSGYLQLAKTGNLPIGMISAMRALEKTFEKIGTSSITKEDVAASFLNTVPTIIRGMTKIAGETGFLKDGISPLTEDQKRFYGVSDYSQLSADQKAKVLLEELMAEGIINNNIDANVIQELTAAAFNKEAIPNELVKGAYEKIKNRVKGFGQSTMEAASNSYSFSDSMFKAIFYINEKKKNWDTYGSVMRQKGASMEEVEKAMKDRTAIAVKQQMPTYDRSPEFLKALSKFPLIGSFVQFDFQSKVNDKNIVVDIYNMVKDSIEMNRQGYSKEANILGKRAFGKTLGLGLFSSLSYGLYKIFNAAISGFSDDDDEAIASLQSEYRKNNQVLHLDGNKKGEHKYLDISRIDPQSVYFKYFNAFKRGGFDEGVEEILKPYISPDIFAGSFIQTMSNLDKYGNVSKEIEGMNFAEKMKYLAEERILPSGTVGQIIKIIDGFNEREVNEVSMNGWYEMANTFLGAKPRTINIDKEIGNKLNYDHLKKINDEAQSPLKLAIKDYDTKLDQFKRGKGGITQSELNDAKLEVELQNKEATEKANEILGQARYMVDKYKKLGYNEGEIRKSLDDANTPQYLINLLMSDKDAVFDNEGNVVKGGIKRFKRRKSDLDLNLDMNLDLNLDMKGF